MACLGDDTIVAMLEGGLAPDAGQRARAHISSCDACRRLVSAAVGPVIAPPTVVGFGSGGAETVPGASRSFVAHAPGSVIAGRYRIERLIGEGGMGRVFAARQIGLERSVALKILQPEIARNAVALKRFEREARLIAQLTSDQVVRVHDLGATESGEPFLVMELLDGEDLAQVVARGPIAVAQATAWIIAACEALGEAHALGIVHRDLKPSNLFVTRQGRLKVLDFGLAKLASTGLSFPGREAGGITAGMTGVGAILGSPHYMAPEQILGAADVDARADLWSLGATLYHLVAGAPPFPQPTLEAVFAHILTGTMPRLDVLPPEVASVVQRALAREPAMRFGSAAELAAALRGAAPVVAPAVVDRPVIVTPAQEKKSRLVPVLIGMLVLTMSIIVGGAIWVARSMTTMPSTLPTPAPGAGVTSPATSPLRSPSRSTTTTTTTPTGAPMGALDEVRLRKRLEKLGWKVSETRKEDILACTYTHILANLRDAWADVLLLECGSEAAADDRFTYLHGIGHGDWVTHDGNLVLDVGTNNSLGSDEKQAKALSDALLEP